jgi:membrane protein
LEREAIMKMVLKDFWGLVKSAASKWSEDKAPRMGAALAYYTIFSMAPLLVITVAIAGMVFGKDAAEGRMVGELQGLVGPDGGRLIQTMICNASEPSTSIVATVIGVLVLVLGAMGVFGELQDSLNTIWEVQPRPGRGILGMLQDRLLSFVMVMGVAFLLLCSLVISAGLAAVGSLLGQWETSLVGQAINFGVSFVVITLLFAMIYKLLPDAHTAWGDVWLGAALTALLFSVGKMLIGLYLGHSTIGSTYGAAGSLAVLLVWLYYSAQVFLFGAELTQVYANRFGSKIIPAPDAIPLTEEARMRQGILHADKHQPT